MRHKSVIPLFLVFILAVSASAFGRESPLDRELNRLTEKVVLDMNAAGEARVAFLDFVDLDGKTTRFGRFVVEELRTRFYSTKRFTVVERRSLDAVLEEQKLQLSGLISENSAVNIGKLVGANALVTGNIADLGREVRIIVRLVSVDSATVFAVARAIVPKDDMVAELMGKTLVEAPAAQTAQGSGMIIEHRTKEEVESLAEGADGEMSGSWLLDSSIAMSIVQRGEEITGKYDRASGTIRGKVEGRLISFRWSEDTQRKDGSQITGTGEMTLSEDGMMLSGLSRWADGRSREPWVAIRSRTDPRAEQLVADSRAYRRGLWNGLWIANTSEELELFQSGNKVSAAWNDGGAILYGFARSRSLTFYKIYPSDKQDGTLMAVHGEITLSEDEMRFDGLTRWARGNTQGRFNGIRSNEDPLVEEHIDTAKRGRRGRFAGRWLVNDTDALRLYQNDELLYGRWAGSRDELWGFVSGATIDFYELREAPSRDGTLHAFSGSAALSEDEFAFTGLTRWVAGNTRSRFNGIRTPQDERTKELIEWAQDMPGDGFSGLWLVNDKEELEIRQTDESFFGRWNGRSGEVIYGFVTGRAVKFYGVSESDRRDGSFVAYTGEGVLAEDRISFTGLTRWSAGNTRGRWNGHRRTDDPLVAAHRDAARRRGDGLFNGRWFVADTGTLELSHSGGQVFGSIAETGEEIYGFVSGRVLDFYGTTQQVDGSVIGFSGQVTMGEDNESFEGHTRWSAGNIRSRWNGMRQ